MLGKIFKSCSSTWFGFLPFVKPVLLLTLNTWVSTAIVGLLKAAFKTTFAVFLPTPGRFIKSSKLFGTLLWYRNQFTLLTSVVLSAQCTDTNVNNVTKDIYKKYYTPKHFADLGIKKIKKMIKSIGLFNMKAKNLYNLSKILVEKYQSKVPNNFEDLINLPGVGRKTANVVLNAAFNKPTIAVDTHVFRVSNRTGLASGKNPRSAKCLGV